ncbi:MAG: hypothetical protein Fues2KO_04990 [Fuerstiella sp.]
MQTAVLVENVSRIRNGDFIIEIRKIQNGEPERKHSQGSKANLKVGFNQPLPQSLAESHGRGQ